VTPTYDIVNAGPRNRFTAYGRVVSNSGRVWQPQNLPRPTMDAEAVERGIQAIKADCEDLLFDNVSEICVNAVRGCLVAAPGKKLLVADLSNIEGRVLAWLAGEEWKVQAFKDFDAGVGHDLYILAYARAFNMKPENVSKSLRQLGKVMELALGYQGSVGAFLSMAANYGMSMPEDKVLELVRAWRRANRRINSLWYDVEAAAKSAIREPAGSFTVRDLTFSMKDGWLRMRLPSGRYLSYPKAQIGVPCRDCKGAAKWTEGGVMEDPRDPRVVVCQTCGGTGLDDTQIRYWGVNQYTRKWEMLETYGGKFCIAAGTPVLTDSGWLPIEDVRGEHRVWDGVEWVSHKGLARNGVKAVISAHGVTMTPDHKVLTTEGWICASQSERFERADARVSYGIELLKEQRSEIPVDVPVCMRSDYRYGRLGLPEAKEKGHTSVLWLPPAREHRSEEHNARDVETQGFCSVALDERPLPSTNAPRVGQLWRTWDHGMRALANFFSGLLGRHGGQLPERADTRAARQFFWLPPGELLLGHSATAGSQHPAECADRHALGPCDSGRGCRARGSELHDPWVPAESWDNRGPAVCAPRMFAEVLDLVDCGPRNRFVVRGADGGHLIVHNCENAVQAIARDIFLNGMRRAELTGYPVVLRVHDELGCEVPDDPSYTVEALCGFMTAGEHWSFGLPLAAAGGEMYRYAKED